MEIGWFENDRETKKILIERQPYREYINLNTGIMQIANHSQLEHLSDKRVASVCLLAVYILSGSDYVSRFYKYNHKHILRVFMKYEKTLPC